MTAPSTPDIYQILLGIITLLMSAVVFFLQDLWRRVRKWERTGVVKEFCALMHEDVAKYLHQHGNTGNAGEVIHKP